MTPIRTLTVAAAAAFCFYFSQPIAPAQAVSGVDGASKFIESVGDQALAIVTNKTFSKDQKQVKLERLFDDNVDFPWVARFVMGRFWRQATETQKAHYLKAYQKFEVWHYTSRFSEYSSGSFKITNTRDDGDSEYTVSMQIQPGDAQAEPVLVDYRVRHENGTRFRIFDITVEGVSMITTQRSEFASVITNNGIDYLIAQLSAKSKTGDTTMSN